MFRMFNNWSEDRKFTAMILGLTLMIMGVVVTNGCKTGEKAPVIESTPASEAAPIVAGDDDDSAADDDDSAPAPADDSAPAPADTPAPEPDVQKD